MPIADEIELGDRRSFEDGFYVVQLEAGEEPEVARFAGEVFVLHGSDHPFDPADFFKIGPRLLINPRTLAPSTPELRQTIKRLVELSESISA